MKKRKLIGVLSAILCLIGQAVLAYGFIKWIVPLYAVSLLMIAASFLGLGLTAFAHAKKKVLKSILLCLGAVVLSAGIVAVFNNIIFKSAEPVYAVAMTLPIIGIMLGIFCARATGRKFLAPFFCIIMSAIIVLVPTAPKIQDLYIRNYSKKAAAPTGLSTYTEKQYTPVTDADFYVCAEGDDSNTGSEDKPFLTLERAKKAVKELSREGRDGITVAIKSGEYSVSDFTLEAEDGGSESCSITYCAYGDGEVILKNSVTLDEKTAVEPTSNDIYERFPDSVKEKLVCYDLSSFGITAEELGKVWLTGSHNTAQSHDNTVVGDTPPELFLNGERQSVARYPDSGFTGTGKVISANEDGHDRYKLSRELSERISGWANTDGAIIYGFFQSDWADSCTTIMSFDSQSCELVTDYYSAFGCIDDAPCYFYNIPEELDCVGEWYIDAPNRLLYYYPETEEGLSLELNVSYKNIIKVEADFVTIKGLTFKGSCGDALSITGNNNTVTQCKICEVGGNAVVSEGYDNLVCDNEITGTGKGGIILGGGDREKLVYGNSRADNNYIHDWAVTFCTYSPAVTLEGVGNVCSHNEICNTAHEAITFKGNCHTVEYNTIHDVCLRSNDAGAIYSGLHWDWYGTEIKYNCIYNIGSKGYSPAGIYLDDALSGITVYGNLLVNVPRTGIQVGGGRDNDIRNNMIINTNIKAIDYDQRAIDAFSGGWFQAFTNKEQTSWASLLTSPYKTEIWKEKFPEMAQFSEDETDLDNPYFVCNPAGSTVRDNIIVNLTGKIGFVSEKVFALSDVGNNAVYNFKAGKALFADYDKGNYLLAENTELSQTNPDFENLPISEIGRY